MIEYTSYAVFVLNAMYLACTPSHSLPYIILSPISVCVLTCTTVQNQFLIYLYFVTLLQCCMSLCFCYQSNTQVTNLWSFNFKCESTTILTNQFHGMYARNKQKIAAILPWSCHG